MDHDSHFQGLSSSIPLLSATHSTVVTNMAETDTVSPFSRVSALFCSYLVVFAQHIASNLLSSVSAMVTAAAGSKADTEASSPVTPQERPILTVRTASTLLGLIQEHKMVLNEDKSTVPSLSSAEQEESRLYRSLSGLSIMDTDVSAMTSNFQGTVRVQNDPLPLISSPF